MADRKDIWFLFDSKEVRLDLSDGPFRPTTTVLQWLRATGYTGTKEGCAEGDCGACSVVIARPDDHQGIVYTTIDSCLVFLPMLDGAALITVEQLGTTQQMHPVQQAMVDADGSQCGYCTPGFVMSMFGMYREAITGKVFRQEEIEDSLSGNLCRCTGYRSIMEAAGSVLVNPRPDQFETSQSDLLNHLLELPRDNVAIHRADQLYVRPNSLRKALDLLAANPALVPFHGATDLALRVTKKNELLSSLLDLGEIAELKKSELEQEELHIGAGVSLEAVRFMVEDSHPALKEIIDVFGSRQIRELATLGGNIASASPIGDCLPVLFAYKAEIELKSNRGSRVFPVAEFITGYRKTLLNPDELITAVHISRLDDKTGVYVVKSSKRRDLDISTVNLAVRLKLNGNSVEEIDLVYGGMAAMVKRAASVADALTGKEWTLENIRAAAALIQKDFSPISDARASAKSRMILAMNLIEMVWHKSQIEKALS